jgi:hypothetical protein
VAELKAGFSTQSVIGGKIVPLESSDVDLDSVDKADLQDALKNNLEFSLPPDQPVNLDTSEFIGWLKEKLNVLGINLDLSWLEELLGGTATITEFTVKGTGAFSIALNVDFEGGLELGELSRFVDIEKLGLQLAYTP